jgi:nucleotide-binding universal stress UspA family protein
MNNHKILIAVDNSSAAEKVATKGLALAQQLNAEITLVSVVDTDFLISDGGVPPNEVAESIKTDLKKSQQVLIDKILGKHKVGTFVEEGKPYEVILKVADERSADLIIIGTHGRTGLSHLLMGSVAENVVRHSKIPVLIIPSK